MNRNTLLPQVGDGQAENSESPRFAAGGLPDSPEMERDQAAKLRLLSYCNQFGCDAVRDALDCIERRARDDDDGDLLAAVSRPDVFDVL